MELSWQARDGRGATSSLRALALILAGDYLLGGARGGIEELSAHLSVGASAHVTRLGCWRNGFKVDPKRR
jgi:hypothetical protein